ncbi:T9SS type A sorting domain-containing protein [Brumimicrobium glaciale]|uniref:T9SS type A sorting domain-containing protein n=1 Tax=Brumimicrobium glaciale TaxID=200475 RepID=A0A4Q4KMI4_9FLAO|nr:M64 family metallopeptidase [Brumimicrobium glaciale]RYM34210.1 T9SS type A sorting domain-containing protein [Brumimicrobium glaciale]
MKKIILLPFVLLFCGVTFSQVFDTIVLHNSGPSDKRINLVILGDGYTSADQGKFITDATGLKDYLFTKVPYSNYSEYFNVIAIKVISNESGIKHPATATDVAEPVFPISNPDTYLETAFDYQDIHRCIYTSNTNLTTQVLAANVPNFDIAVVVVNTPEYGGCAGDYAYFSAHTNAKEIFIHEIGHSFANLADEYWFASTGERPNKTQDDNPSTNKWKNWIGTDNVDIFPFPEDASWNRPHQSCEMRFLNNEYCAVCKEATIERIHQIQGPIDDFNPTQTSLQMGSIDLDFEVSLILPNPNTLEFSWELNGVEIDILNTNISIASIDLVDGLNTLNFSVVDNTPLVRTDNHETIHLNTVTWQINKSGLGIEEIQAKESSFVIYPNPSTDVIYLKSNKKSTRKLTFELLSTTGQIIKTETLSSDASQTYLFKMGDIESQTYLLNIYDDNGIKLYTHRIVKK